MSIPYRDETVIPAASARTTGANGRQSSQSENGMQNVGSWADRVKLLWWDGTGLCLLSKRLEGGQFRFPRIEDGVMRLSAAQLSALVKGLEGHGRIFRLDACRAGRRRSQKQETIRPRYTLVHDSPTFARSSPVISVSTLVTRETSQIA